MEYIHIGKVSLADTVLLGERRRRRLGEAILLFLPGKVMGS